MRVYVDGHIYSWQNHKIGVVLDSLSKEHINNMPGLIYCQFPEETTIEEMEEVVAYLKAQPDEEDL